MWTNRKLNLGLLLAVAGTFLTSISMIGTLEQTSIESRGSISRPAKSDVWERLDDITDLLRQNHLKVIQLRQKLDRLTFKFNETNEDEQDGQNVLIKRHLMDTVHVEQPPVTSHGKIMPSVEFGKIAKKYVKEDLQLISSQIDKSERMFDCKDIASMDEISYIGNGYTKSVSLVSINGTKVALKRPTMGGKDMTHCVESGTSRADCWTLSSYKVLKEMALLHQLNHPGIIKLLGFCTEEQVNNFGRFSDVSLVTEVGSPIDFLRLVQTPWEDRLRMIYDLTSLLVYLADSPLGPLTIHDFKPTQFVLVNGQMKLADLDDIDTRLPSCSRANQCVVPIPGDKYQHIPCNSAGLCPEYADRLNLQLAWQHFYLLQQHGGPIWLQKQLDVFLNKTRSAEISSREALRILDQVVTSYKKGNYNVSGQSRKYSYNYTLGVDLPGRFDYWCTYTRNPHANSCVFSAASEDEAEYICSLDDNCRAFVITDEITWTGRRLVYLKSGFGRPEKKPGCKLFVRIS